jgi:putative tricarboxylic transport membrane protein
MMRVGEVTAALFWLAIALGITWSGHDLGLGSLRDPGPGFMFFWVGLVMTVLSAATVIAAARTVPGGTADDPWRGTRWWLVPYVIVLLVLYAWAMPVLGFMTTTALFLLILFTTIDRTSWVTPALAAIIFTAVAYIVFHRALGTQLPAGIAEQWLTTYLPAIFGRS